MICDRLPTCVFLPWVLSGILVSCVFAGPSSAPPLVSGRHWLLSATAERPRTAQGRPRAAAPSGVPLWQVGPHANRNEGPRGLAGTRVDRTAFDHRIRLTLSSKGESGHGVEAELILETRFLFRDASSVGRLGLSASVDA